MSEPLKKGDRVELVEEDERRRGLSLGVVVKVSPTGYIHVEWDCGDFLMEGWFSPAKAAAVLRLAQGEDALPRHTWCFEAPASLEQPVCFVCKAAQTDDNEFGPCI